MRLEKLGNIADIQIGKTPQRANVNYWGKGNSWVSISDLKEQEITSTKEEITDLAVEECGCKLIPKGTLLMSFKLSIGKLAFTGKDLYTNEAICGFQIKDKKLIADKYLYYALKNTKFVGSNVAVKGATLNKASLNNLKIPLVGGIETQLHIANILTQAENLITQRKESIRLLDEYLKSVFLEMFGDPERNEMDWIKGKVILFADCIVPGRDKPKSFTGTIPWLTTEDLQPNGFTYESKKKLGLDQNEIKQVRARVIPAGSVLMTCVGDLGILSINKIDCVVNQQLHTYQCNVDINNIFLMFSLSFQKRHMYKTASTTTVPYMNKTICNSIPAIKPPLSLQNRFAEIVEKVEALKTQYQQSLQELENLYGSLSQKAFNGELVPKTAKEELTLAAEPTAIYSKNKTIDFKPTNVDYYKRTLLAAEIVWQLRGEPTLGHLKLQKLIYLCQKTGEMQLPTNFLKQAMGPYDPQLMRSIDKQLRIKNWFEYRQDELLKYQPLEQAGQHRVDFEKYFASELSNIQFVINTFKTDKSRVVEIVATLYGCMEDILSKNELFSTSLLLKRFYEWSEEKKKFPEQEIWPEYERMLRIGMVPGNFRE